MKFLFLIKEKEKKEKRICIYADPSLVSSIEEFILSIENSHKG